MSLLFELIDQWLRTPWGRVAIVCGFLFAAIGFVAVVLFSVNHLRWQRFRRQEREEARKWLNRIPR